MLKRIQKYLFAKKANEARWKSLAQFFHRNRVELTGGFEKKSVSDSKILSQSRVMFFR